VYKVGETETCVAANEKRKVVYFKDKVMIITDAIDDNILGFFSMHRRDLFANFFI